MILLTLQRTTPAGAPRTFGELRTEDGRRLCYTLEDEVRELPGVPVHEWKIKGATAIPSGRYRVTLEYSPRFGPGTLTLNDVPGFDGVRMHAGNTENDTEGCPLLGMAVCPVGIVGGTSRFAVALVKHLVLAAIDDGEEVYLDVVNATATA
jgi:hypothetical protein